MNLLITICARGGSKGIPGKNIKNINGTPLISFTIRSAQTFAQSHGADIALSTDSEEIREVASSFGLKTDYIRPESLATDSAGKIGVIKDVLEYHEKLNQKEYDYVLDMDVTSPLRTQKDLEEALETLRKCPEADNIFSVSPASRNPYFNMVEPAENGFVKLVKPLGVIKSRQAAPVVYDMNASLYFFRRRFFEKDYGSSVTEDKSLAYVMNHICFDLDEPHDFTIMEVMMREKLFNFEF